MSVLPGYRWGSVAAHRWAPDADNAFYSIWGSNESFSHDSSGFSIFALFAVGASYPLRPRDFEVREACSRPFGSLAGAHWFYSRWDDTSGRMQAEASDAQTTNCAVQVIVSKPSGYFRRTETLVSGIGSDALLGLGSFAALFAEEGVTVGAGDLCRDRISRLIEAFESAPTSYNQILVQGALDYCQRVISRLGESHEVQRDLLRKIQDFVSLVEGVRSQQLGGGPSTLSLIDLQLVEDKFELLQKKAAELNILPMLDEIPTAELLNP